jgi:NADPH:quinone reductase-like Zn-dependent oxidoreductase
MGVTVVSTTRSSARLSSLAEVGVEYPLVDDGSVAAKVRALYPSGVDGAIELVGTPTLPDTLASVRVHGTVCFTGMLSNEWIVRDFYPIGYLPKGVRLTGYGGDAGDLPASVLQQALDDIAAGTLTLGEPTVYRMDDIRTAHDDMEQNRVVGKLVVVT